MSIKRPEEIQHTIINVEAETVKILDVATQLANQEHDDVVEAGKLSKIAIMLTAVVQRLKTEYPRAH